MGVSVVVAGAGGRMGVEIVRAVLSRPGFRVAGALEQSAHPSLGQDVGLNAAGAPCGVCSSDSVDDAILRGSVCIDFTAPDATLGLARRVVEAGGAGLVVGTTGFSVVQTEQLRGFASAVPIVFSPNMSLGVNLLFHLTKVVAARLKGAFDIEIVEAHHRHKKDSPSGTARRIAEIAASALGTSYSDSVCNGREGFSDGRPAHEIGVHAVRGGDIVGDHTVLFAGEGERIELRHIAHSRATFAQGAVTAAAWLCGRKPALYTMADVLDF